MSAQDVGWKNNRIVLGKHSGRAAVKARLEDLGVTFDSPAALNIVFERFKALADKKMEIFDEDLQAIVGHVEESKVGETYRLNNLEVISKTGTAPLAKLEMTVDSTTFQTESEGGGPVDAVFKAIEKIAKSGADLQLYSVNAITQGTDSQGDVTVRLEKDGVIVNGVGADTDIICASAKAYMHALNLLRSGASKVHWQEYGV